MKWNLNNELSLEGNLEADKEQQEDSTPQKQSDVYINKNLKRLSRITNSLNNFTSGFSE